MNHQQKTLNTPYAFGMPMPGRSYTSENYRFGFNGMEKDDEVAGQGNSYTTFWRQYDPRLGRWMSFDPVFQPYQSPYGAFANNPIFYIDPYGNCENCPKDHKRKSKKLDRLINKVRKKEGLSLKNKNHVASRNGLDKEIYGKVEDRFPKKMNKIQTGTYTSTGNGWKRTDGVVKGTTKESTFTIDERDSNQGTGDFTQTYNLPNNTTTIQVVGDNYGLPDRVSINQEGSENPLFDMGSFQPDTYDTGQLPIDNSTSNQVRINIRASDQEYSNWEYRMDVTTVEEFEKPRPIEYTIDDYQPK